MIFTYCSQALKARSLDSRTLIPPKRVNGMSLVIFCPLIFTVRSPVNNKDLKKLI